MNLRFALASSFSALFGASSAFAGTPADYAYAFPIEIPAATGNSSAWRIELTPAIYAWTQDASLRDVEVFNAAGAPVPFARFTAAPTATQREQRAALPLLDLPALASPTNASDLRLIIDRDADGRLRRIDAGEKTPAAERSFVRDWVLDASGFDHSIDQLVLSWSTPASGVVARFSVEAGDDLQSWHGAGSGTVLALEQEGAHLERHEIALNGIHAKYLRLHRLDDGPILAGLAAQARSFERNPTTPARRWLDAGLLAASAQGEPPPPGVTRFDYGLPAALPVEVARIQLANDNALAPLTLSARFPDSVDPQWNVLAQTTTFRLRSGDETLSNADIEVASASRLREFRIESRTPLTAAPHLSLGFQPDGFVFLAEGNGPYTLAVGSVRAQRASYPVEAALASLRAKLGQDWQPPLATLGAAKESAGAAAFKTLPVPIQWSRWLLWGVLVAGAALVGGFALSLLRGAKGDENRPE
ncbi:MAG: DUF3999 domain-containing protein [Dokdonella sp.]